MAPHKQPLLAATVWVEWCIEANPKLSFPTSCQQVRWYVADSVFNAATDSIISGQVQQHAARLLSFRSMITFYAILSDFRGYKIEKIISGSCSQTRIPFACQYTTIDEMLSLTRNMLDFHSLWLCPNSEMRIFRLKDTCRCSKNTNLVFSARYLPREYRDEWKNDRVVHNLLRHHAREMSSNTVNPDLY